MSDDFRLTNQLKGLGKKIFQFRDMIAKIDIPERFESREHADMFWEVFVAKTSSCVALLKQIETSLTPDLFHLAVHPSDKIWRNPGAVPDLLAMPGVNSDSEPCGSVNESPFLPPSSLETLSLQVAEVHEMLDSVLFSRHQDSKAPTSARGGGNSNGITGSALSQSELESQAALIKNLLNTRSVDRVVVPFVVPNSTSSSAV